MIWSKLSFSPPNLKMKRKRNCYPQKPASSNSYSILGSTLETIYSKVVATLDVLPNPLCGRIGEDKKIVKFVTQKSKFTHTHLLYLGWQAFHHSSFEPAIHLQSKVAHWVGLTLNPMKYLYYYYYYIQRRPQALLNPKNTCA